MGARIGHADRLQIGLLNQILEVVSSPPPPVPTENFAWPVGSIYLSVIGTNPSRNAQRLPLSDALRYMLPAAVLPFLLLYLYVPLRSEALLAASGTLPPFPDEHDRRPVVIRCNGTLIVETRRYRYVNDPAGPDPRLPL